MTSTKLKKAVLSGLRPTDATDVGPFISSVESVYGFITSGRLLRFGGVLDSRFKPVPSIDEACRIAFSPTESDFHWDEDSRALWGDRVPEDVFGEAVVYAAFRTNLLRIQDRIDTFVSQFIPDTLRHVVYDEVVSDLATIATSFARFGMLDDFYSLLWEAYLQGGWPCGCTGPRPDPDVDFTLVGRYLFVYWPNEDRR